MRARQQLEKQSLLPGVRKGCNDDEAKISQSATRPDTTTQDPREGGGQKDYWGLLSGERPLTERWPVDL